MGDRAAGLALEVVAARACQPTTRPRRHRVASSHLRWLAFLLVTWSAGQGPTVVRADESLVVSVAELATRLADPDLVLLHVGDRAEYEQAHIPGARYVALSDLSVSDRSATGLVLELPPPDQLRQRLAALGITDRSRIVVYYGRDWISPATRVVFTLDHAGLGDRTALLDGGQPAWTRAGHPVTSEIPPAREGDLSPSRVRSLVVDAEFVRTHLQTPGYVLVDARATAFYEGTQTGGSKERPHRTGHIPFARNVPFTEIADEQLMLRPVEQLRALFTKAGVKPGDTVVAYCHIGQQASAVVFAARRLGHPVRLYDGSFEDWSRRAEFPVEAPAATAPAAGDAVKAPAPREIAPGTYLLPGAMLPDRGPDGNTVVVVAPAGLIVIDTGRHAWHSDGILDIARTQRRPVAAVVNTHWHLDHSSGNRRVKQAHPSAKLYTTTAVERALAPGGFLARTFAAARERPPDPKVSATRREETDLFIATMDASDSLRPDVAVTEPARLDLAGRSLSVRVATDAVTDADLWLYDEATRVAVIGDLVTLPAPFFETACPRRWEAALDEVWATPFTLAVPGHGPPLDRNAFDTYRRAFAAFRACVGSERAAADCASGWARDVGALLDSDGDRSQAADYAAYYVGFLRKSGGASPDCRVK